MAKGYLIDSNVVIAYLDNKLPEQGMTLLNEIIDDIPNISVITQIEVLRFNAPSIIYKVLEDFVNESRIFDLTDNEVKHTIAICKAHKIKLPDAIIAATAIAHELILLTRNIADFKKIADLKVIDPWINT